MPMARKKANNITAQHGAGRQHVAGADQTQLVPQGFKDGILPQPAQQAQHRRDRKMLVFEVYGAVGDRHKHPVHHAVEPGAVVNAKLHYARQILPNAAGEQQTGWSDLAHVDGHGLRTFREVDLYAVDQVVRETESLFGKPRHGAERQPVIRLPAIHVLVVQRVSVYQLVMRHLRKLRQSWLSPRSC